MKKIIALATTTILSATALSAEVNYVTGSYDFQLNQYNEDLGNLTASTGVVELGFEYGVNQFTFGAQLDAAAYGYGVDGDITDTTSISSLVLSGAYAINDAWSVVVGFEQVDEEGYTDTFTTLGGEYAMGAYTFGAGVVLYDDGSDNTAHAPYAFADYDADAYSAAMTVLSDEGTTMFTVETAYDLGVMSGGVEVFYVNDDVSAYVINTFGDYEVGSDFTVGLDLAYSNFDNDLTSTTISLVGGYSITDEFSAKLSLGQQRLSAEGDSTTAGTIGLMIDYELGAPTVSTFDTVPSVTDYANEIYGALLNL